MMQIVGVQPDIAWEDKAATFERVDALLAGASIAPGALVALPEMFSTGFSMNVAGVEEGPERSAERFLAERARRYEAWVLGGVVRRDDDGKGRNEAVVFDPRGEEVARYAKMYPMGPAGETEHYTAGEGVVTFGWGDWVVSPSICYDVRFPELYRRAVGAGAQLMVVIANFPAVRETHWLALLTARAIENQAYVLGVNRCGDDPNQHYTGHTRLIDPRGEVVADAGEEPGVLTAELDLEGLKAYREKFPVLRDMRG